MSDIENVKRAQQLKKIGMLIVEKAEEIVSEENGYYLGFEIIIKGGVNTGSFGHNVITLDINKSGKYII